MQKLGALLVFAVVFAVANSFLVVPPDCTSGAGSSLNILVYVTNLSVTATTLNVSQPYNLTKGVTYNVTFGFVPTIDTSSATQFNVTATYLKDGVNVTEVIASTIVGPYQATSVAAALMKCEFDLVTKIAHACLGSPFMIGKVFNLDWAHLLTCIPDALLPDFYSYLPGSVSATVYLTVPTDLNINNATFSGIVYGNAGKVMTCKQGTVNLVQPS